MGKLKPIQISERELEQYVIENPGDLEEGFRVLYTQWPTDSGPLDILGVDEDGVLVVVELKAREDDGQLLQGLRYYDYVTSNVASIAKHVSSEGTSVLDDEPRLMLIAPSFSQTLKRICKYVDVDLELKIYKSYKLPSGEIDVVFESIEIEEREEVKVPPSLEDKLNRIQNDEMRKLAQRFLNDLEILGFEMKMVHDEWISLKHGGKRIATMGCMKKFFVIETQTEGGWKRYRIQSQNEYNKLFELLKAKAISSKMNQEQ
ncbi:MAG: endonuclease NucS [Thaumarchaeota archaeon]|nr:endonuclease NucS [Candidatus Calditenuaceae archaeon]MDW8186918.1 endonuclease NucS [Nitrososphaerota archaeon]